MSLRLRLTTADDLSFVIRIERAEAKFVRSQSLQEHANYLSDADARHLIIEADRKVVGYVILAGLKNADESIELRRIVIAEKGKGYGRAAVKEVKKMAFEQLGAHRLWLDVKDYNESARRLYESEGFQTEGIWRECVKTETGWDSYVFMSILQREYEA